MTALERTYRFLIARARREHDEKLAKSLMEWGEAHYDLDLSDA